MIDDVAGHTLASASTVDTEVAAQVAGKKKRERAMVGKIITQQRAIDAGVKEVVFDRGGYIYHGHKAGRRWRARAG